MSAEKRRWLNQMCEDCCCETSMGCHSHGRRFLTKEEQIKKLENYSDELKKEITAVNERIKKLKS